MRSDETIPYLDFLPGLACEFNNYRDTVYAIRDGSIRCLMSHTCRVYSLILRQNRIDDDERYIVPDNTPR